MGIVDITGQEFGQLTAIKIVGDNPKRYMWLCQCTCGNTRLVQLGKLRDLIITSCRSCALKRITKHGHSRKDGAGRSLHTPTYKTWYSMRSRCRNPKTTGYEYYGGRGIKVCERWDNSFAAFLEDMGEKPEGMTIDRYPDKNGNYEPGNVRWATYTEQNNNTRRNPLIEYQGRSQTAAQWAVELDFEYVTLEARLQRGWSIERAFTTPVQKRVTNK